ncbi:hypothetical protein MTO96_042567 [Rhipicephalus appendiculatus]
MTWKSLPGGPSGRCLPRRTAQDGFCRRAAIFVAGLSLGLALTSWLPETRLLDGAFGQRPQLIRQRPAPPFAIPRTPILYDLNSSDHDAGTCGDRNGIGVEHVCA